MLEPKNTGNFASVRLTGGRGCAETFSIRNGSRRSVRSRWNCVQANPLPLEKFSGWPRKSWSRSTFRKTRYSKRSNSMANFKKTEPPFSMLAWNTKRETATRSGSALSILFWIYVSRSIRLGRFVYIFLFAAVPRPRSRTPLTGKCDLASALNIFIPMQKIIGEYISSVAVVPMNKLCRRVCCHFHKSWRPIGHPLSRRAILA